MIMTMIIELVDVYMNYGQAIYGIYSSFVICAVMIFGVII